MDYFNRSNDEELGGISYCSSDSTLTSSKISSISLGNMAITIDKYDKTINTIIIPTITISIITHLLSNHYSDY